MIKQYGYGSEEDPDANQYAFEDSAKRADEVNISVRQQMIETLLKDANLYENEPTTNCYNQFDNLASCEVADENLTRLNKIYPIQKAVWPHILNRKSAILVGNTDYYPHLLYLPPVCHLIKVIFTNIILFSIFFKNVSNLHSFTGGPRIG